MKTCIQCQLSKELKDFSPHGRCPGIFKSLCKSCTNLNSRAKRKVNPELARQKSREQYWKDPEKARRATKKWKLENVESLRQKELSRYWQNPEKFRALSRARSPEKNRAARLKSTYGISLEEYNAMFLEQAGKCAICKEDEGTRRLCIDHDHATGKVRALICDSCNVGLGRFKDSEALVRLAADYLRYHARLGKETT